MPTRQENVDKYGQGHVKEAQGLALVRDAIRADGRLEFKRCAEGARADFVVWHPGRPDRALGVQLKTCHSTRKMGKDRLWMAFQNTRGYEGLLVLLIAFTEQTPRAWVLSGKDAAKQSSLAFSSAYCATSATGLMWQRREVQMQKLPQRFINAIQLGGIVDIELQRMEDLVPPPPGHHLVEYLAQQWLRARLPLVFEEPDVESQAHDFVVDGAKWQLKVTSYVPGKDRFTATLHRGAGKRGQRILQQYSGGDFQWLALQLPLADVRTQALSPRLYLIPMRELLSRGRAGRTDVSGAAVYLYPHRVPKPGRHWTETYVIDLTSAEAALADYERVKALA